MSVTFGFYNSVNHDRKYSAEQVSMIFDGIITDGVYHSVGEAFSVAAGTGMSVNVGSGRAWFDHTWTYNDALIVVPVSDSHQVYTRIDALIIQIDKTNRTNTICVKSGTPGSAPVKPTMTSSADLHEVPLAYITVPPNTTEIQPSQIEVVIGTSECPFVAGVQNGVSIDALVKNWKVEFDNLFTRLEDQVSQATSATLIDGSVTHTKLAKNAIKYEFRNIEVVSSAVKEDTTYSDEGYGYVAELSLAGVDETMTPEVVFGLDTIVNGNIAPIAESFGTPGDYNGGVRIFLASSVSENFLIPTIICWRSTETDADVSIIDGDDLAYG